MTTTTTKIFKRYPGPKPFTTEEQAFFFGREKEREDLVRMVNAEKLVVLFGKSGLGKSSLINAGLLPALTSQNKNWLPIPIRLRVSDGKTTPLQIVRQHLDRHEKLQVTEGGFLADTTLWHCVKRHQQTDTATKYFILLDQFEEFFTYPPDQQKAFRSELAELLYTAIPQNVITEYQDADEKEQIFLATPMDVRVMISMRSDRLSLLHSFKDHLPAILNARYELKGLTPIQARQAIELPARWGDAETPLPVGIEFTSPPFRYESATVDFIIAQLSKSNALTDDPSVETVQLQLVCQNIEQKIQSGSIKSPVGVKDLPPFDDIFKSFYLKTVDNLPPSVKMPSRRIMEEELISGQLGDEVSRRVTVDQEKLLEALVKQRIRKPEAEKLLNALVDTHLLRREPNSVGGVSYEICHDTFLNPMLKLKREREREEEKATSSRQIRWVISGLLVLAAAAIMGSNWWSYRQARKQALLAEKDLLKHINDVYSPLQASPPSYAEALSHAYKYYDENPTPQYAQLLATAFYSYINVGGFVYDAWDIPAGMDYDRYFSQKDGVESLNISYTDSTLLQLNLTANDTTRVRRPSVPSDARILGEDFTHSIDNQYIARNIIAKEDCTEAAGSETYKVELTATRDSFRRDVFSVKRPIIDLGFSQNASKLLTISRRDIKMWFIEKPILNLLRGHNAPVNSVQFSPDQTRILSASDDKTARVFGLEGNPLLTLKGHQESVRGAVYSSDGQHIVTADRNGNVRLWGATKGDSLHHIEIEKLIENIYLTAKGEVIVDCLKDSSLVLSIENQRLVVKNTLPHESKNTNETVSADGKLTAQLEDLSGKNPRLTIQQDGNVIAEIKNRIFSCPQFSADGAYLLVVEGNQIWRLPMVETIHKWLKDNQFRKY
jgi:WD domain, G-beta repeat